MPEIVWPAPRVASDWRLYLRLLRYAKPYWPVALVSVLALVVSAALEPVLPALMEPLVDQSLIEKNPVSAWQIPLLIVLVFLVKGIADYIGNVASQTLAQKTIADLRAEIFAHELDLPMAAHQRDESGRMLTRITYDATMVGDAVSSAWLTVVRDSLVLIGLLGFLFYTAWKLTLLVLVMAPLLAWAIRKTNALLRRASKAIQGRVGSLTAMVQESLLGLSEIKIFRAQAFMQARFSHANHSLRRDQMRAIRVQALNVPLVQIIAAVCVAVVIYVASSLSADNQLTPGQFVAFITAMSMIFEPVRRLTNVNAILQRGLAAAESIFGLLDSQAEQASAKVAPIGTAAGSRAASDDGATWPLARAKAQGAGVSMALESVVYAHPGRDQAALSHFSLALGAGEVVALVGPSGSGKSTVVSLLCGFDVPSQGRVLMDGRTIDEWGVGPWRGQIALVSQRTQLFDLSIAENIALGRPEASRLQIEEAARSAHALEFISALPQGLDTPLGSLGERLSGGQRQRIAIARAFLKNAPILILDEATSALDKDSERAVLQGLEALMRGRTVLIVSHAPERLLRVDRLVEMGVGSES